MKEACGWAALAIILPAAGYLLALKQAVREGWLR